MGKNKRKKKWIRTAAVLAAAVILAAGLYRYAGSQGYLEYSDSQTWDLADISSDSSDSTEAGEESASGSSGQTGQADSLVSLDDIPEWDGTSAYVEINGNVPFFTEDEITDEAYEYYADLDSLGRCTYAVACVGTETMPTEERGDISSVYPTGWVQAQYDSVDGGYLYNRCHLIAYMLTGENANEKNLITGTRYMNVEGMLPFETEVQEYCLYTAGSPHVMYRVTPVFDGDNLLASGVLLEAYSVEDGGEGLQFCVYVYNVQPGIEIDYATGESKLAQ